MQLLELWICFHKSGLKKCLNLIITKKLVSNHVRCSYAFKTASNILSHVIHTHTHIVTISSLHIHSQYSTPALRTHIYAQALSPPCLRL